MSCIIYLQNKKLKHNVDEHHYFICLHITCKTLF